MQAVAAFSISSAAEDMLQLHQSAYQIATYFALYLIISQISSGHSNLPGVNSLQVTLYLLLACVIVCKRSVNSAEAGLSGQAGKH